MAKRNTSKPYHPPLTGFEARISGIEVLRNKTFHERNDEHKSRLKNMRPAIDMSPPRSSLMKHMQVNRKKKELEFQRNSAIERENFRLLDSMSKIMVRNAANSVFGVHKLANCPALDGEKARNRNKKSLSEQNQVMLRRILKTKPYYSVATWDRHAVRTAEIMDSMCRYPNIVFTATPARRSTSSLSLLSSRDSLAASTPSARSSSTLEDCSPASARRLKTARAAPPGRGGAARVRGSGAKSASSGSTGALPGDRAAAGGAAAAKAAEAYADDFEGDGEGEIVEEEVEEEASEAEAPAPVEDAGGASAAEEEAVVAGEEAPAERAPSIAEQAPSIAEQAPSIADAPPVTDEPPSRGPDAAAAGGGGAGRDSATMAQRARGAADGAVKTEAVGVRSEQSEEARRLWKPRGRGR